MATKTQQTDNQQWIKKHGDKLSDSTKRAQWIDQPGGTGDHDGATLATRTREVVEDWARRRGAEPAAATRGDDGRPRFCASTSRAAPTRAAAISSTSRGTSGGECSRIAISHSCTRRRRA